MVTLLDRRGAEVPTSFELRRQVRSVLSGHLDDGQLDALLVVCTELLTNGLTHGGGVTAVRVGHDTARHVVHVEVDDNRSDRGPVRTPMPVAGETGGRGLSVVCAFGARWDSTSHPGYKTVRAVLPCRSSMASPDP